MTLRELLTKGYRTLFLAEVDTPFLDAVVLLAFVMGTTKEKLLSSLPDAAGASVEHRYRETLDKRCAGAPVSYIRRAKEFYGLEFYVDERVLVPRPDTETVVERVLSLTRSDPRIKDVHDACTGSGCIAIALKRTDPELRVSASDISAQASEVFAMNAERLLGGGIPFYPSDLLEGVPGIFDVISANPPYLSDDEVRGMSRLGWPEPEISLRGGRNGTETAARLIKGAPRKLRPGGWLVLEAAPEQQLRLYALMDQAGFRNLAVDRDLSGKARVIWGAIQSIGAAEIRKGHTPHG
jgi:release factor glutamine methyltransferase